MTFNLRTSTATGDGPNHWDRRRDLVAAVLEAWPCELLCVQEAQPDQIAFLDGLLPGHRRIGVGRDDGRDGGEHVAVYYRGDRLSCLEHGAFWLSERPEQPGSIGWDAACTRTACWGRFAAPEGEVLVCGTHLDHRGERARREGLALILRRLRECAGGDATVLTGDFNCGIDDEPCRLALRHGLRDARDASSAAAEGPEWTFHGWEPPGTQRIDHIFVSPQVAVRAHRHLDWQRDGRWPSDHLPVVAELALQRSRGER